MTYLNAKKYIQNAVDVTPKNHDGLAKALQQLSNPQKRLKYIRLAGANGKSVCLEMLRHITVSAGYDAGTLRMPLCEELRQNIYIGNTALGMTEFADYTALIRDVCTSNDIILSKTEIMFAIALLAFRDAGCELCIIESSHGDVHISKLLPIPISVVICGSLSAGDKEQISDLRSYICRGIKEVVCATLTDTALNAVEAACVSAGCRLTRSHENTLKINKATFLTTEFAYRSHSYRINLCGRFQARNAALVIDTVDMLNRCGYKLDKNAVTIGLAAVKILGKFDVISISPVIIADSAHSPEALDNLCDTLAEITELKGKKIRICLPSLYDIDNICQRLTSNGYTAEKIFTTSNDAIPENNTVFCKNIRTLASSALVGLSNDTALLIIGKEAFVENARYNILSKLGF